MKLKLKRPLIFLDIETTGLNIVKDRIIEIGLIKFFPDKSIKEYNYLINPEKKIPEETIKIHHITNEMVKNKPRFKEIASELYEILANSDLAGFNIINFDLPFLVEEFLRCNIQFNYRNISVIDVRNIYLYYEKRTLEAAYNFYCNKILTDAHRALNDAKATFEIFLQQLQIYPELSENIEEYNKFTNYKKLIDINGFIITNENNEPIFNFGKYKGLPVADVLRENTGYLGWIMNAEFPQNTKLIINEIYKSIKK
ncbi:MAG: 3'-5' exonuclease [Bacteroidales bacterium]|nr:3'-5' exonuclease [Bacteroidales bacterium]